MKGCSFTTNFSHFIAVNETDSWPSRTKTGTISKELELHSSSKQLKIVTRVTLMLPLLFLELLVYDKILWRNTNCFLLYVLYRTGLDIFDCDVTRTQKAVM